MSKSIEQYIDHVSLFTETLYVPSRHLERRSNVFGSDVDMTSKGGLSYVLGKASSGSRAAACIGASEMEGQWSILRTFKRNHIPMLLAVIGIDEVLDKILDTGITLFKVKESRELYLAQKISEHLLQPVIVSMADELSASDWSADQISAYLGRAEDVIKSATPFQSIVFGENRRRVPTWAHVDHAVLIGAKKDRKAHAYEWVAGSYESRDRKILVDALIKEYEDSQNVGFSWYSMIGSKNPKALTLTLDHSDDVLNNDELADFLKKNKAAIVSPRLVNPVYWPESLLKVERLQILEPIDQSSLAPLMKVWCNDFNAAKVKQSGRYLAKPDSRALIAAVNKLITGETHSAFWLDVPLVHAGSAFPKHEILVQRIAREYPQIEKLQVLADRVNNEERIHSAVPEEIRKMKVQGPPYVWLNRFYDDTHLFFEKDSKEWLADPFQAIPVMPSLTAAFKEQSSDMLPKFQPQNCKDIDALIRSCDHGALPSTLLTLSDLMESGAEQAGVKGGALTPQMKKWVKLSSEVVVERKETIKRVRDILMVSLEKLLDDPKLDDKKEKLQSEAESIIRAIGALPVVINQQLYLDRETRQPGKGQVFIPWVDNMHCTGCGHCALVGDEPSMTMVYRDEALHEWDSLGEVFDKLPTPSDHEIERLVEDRTFDPFAALMLNINNYRSFHSAKSGELSDLLRSIFAALSHHKRPDLKSYIQRVSEIASALSVSVQDLLSKAMPVDDLTGLMTAISQSGALTQLSLNKIMKDWGAHSNVNREALENRLELLTGIIELKDTLMKGMLGEGRSPAVVMIDDSISELAVYPNNPFRFNVIQTNGEDTAGMALGTAEGILKHYLDEIRFLRRAELEAAGRYLPSKHETQILNLSFSDLTEDEKAYAPTIVLLAKEEWLDTCNPVSLNALFDCELPIKLILINEGIIAPQRISAQLRMKAQTKWWFLSQREVFTASCTMAERHYMYQLVKRSLKNARHSVLTLLAPRAEAFDIHPSKWTSLCELARMTHNFMSYHFDPDEDSRSIQSKMHINLDRLKDFDSYDLSYDEAGEEKKLTYSMTWADWAFMQHSLKPYFELTSQDGVGIKEYLSKPLSERKELVPLLMRVGEDNRLQKFKVDQEIIRACEQVIADLDTARTWSGWVSEHPERLREIVAKDLKEEYDEKMQDFEKRLKEEKTKWESEYLLGVKQRMKEILLDMSGM